MSNPMGPDERHAAKRAAVLGARRPRGCKNVLLMAACAALVIGGGVFFTERQGREALRAARLVPPEPETGEVTHPVSVFDDGQCRFFEHRAADGAAVRYFILRSSDGVIRSAFDACDSCWKAGKGYRQAGDDMVCQNCRMRFPSAKVMEVQGGCNPAPLPNRIRDGQVVVRVEDILAGRRYFELRKDG